MSRGVNKVILVGHLGADPETRYMPNGSAVTNIRVATTEAWRDRQTGEQQERTEWHRVVLFARLGEVAAEYLRKGSQVYLEGRLQTRKWQAQDGSDRWSTEIVANDMRMLGGRRQSEDYQEPYGAPGGNWERAPAAPPPAAPFGQEAPPAPARPSAPPPAAPSSGEAPAPTGGSYSAAPPAPEPPGSSEPFDDDIPF